MKKWTGTEPRVVASGIKTQGFNHVPVLRIGSLRPYPCGLRNVPAHSIATRDLRPLRRIANPARLSHAAVFQTSFDDLIPEQRQHSPAHEQRTKLAAPIDAARPPNILASLPPSLPPL